jgi:superfamily I DNA/RNA helicase/Zn-dependent peptidase ImmA (M78 family)
MSAWSELRAQAAAWHDELNPQAGLLRAADFLAAAEHASGVKVLVLPKGDALLDNTEASYDPDGPRILVSAALSPEDRAFHVAHEFGHHRLHHPKDDCHDGDVDPYAAAEPESSAVGESDAYSPKQRREAQANVYGRELLLPRRRLKAACLAQRLTADAIAAELGLPLNLVQQQMADALLLPEDRPPSSDGEPPSLDDSQRLAAEADPGPVQVRAGPGTGKTRTLVARTSWLIREKQADPASILALTYSNASADDLSRRLRLELGAEATAVWCSTFHAFGQELLRLYGDRLGLPSAPKLLDRADSLFLLESELQQLRLDHYFDLQEPLRGLKSVQNAISRAKDELCAPPNYQARAQAMPEGEAKDKALEAAQIYAVYQKALETRGWVDFGDLIARSVELLKNHVDVAAEVRQIYRHILVDEYQDMNAASAALLKQLADPAAGPWVVGDVRQSIYRFRGASPLNMSRFADAFPGADFKDLRVNYRSGGRIVSLFETFGRTMAAAPFASKEELSPNRGKSTGEVAYRVSTERESEAEGLAQEILARRTQSGGFSQHAVLARTHGVLSTLAAHFDRVGVPALYFGDFFERPEVRDLLSLISVAGERDGIGLLRVAQFPRYATPVPDILEMFGFRQEADITMLAALKRTNEASLSAEGRAGLQRLADDLGGVDFNTSPHALISAFLFGKPGAVYGAPLAGDDVTAQQRQLAVYQLLTLAFGHRPPGNRNPKRDFLEHIRRLEVLDEEKELRRLPASASGIDAVQLMTVHAAKGLEFPHVYVPSVSPSWFPPNARPDLCPLPPGIATDDVLMTADAEEESLMFVALSRAKDRLTVSRANRYGGSSRPNPSKLLKPLSPILAPRGEPAPQWTAVGPADPSPLPQKVPGGLSPELAVTALEDYLGCPRRYYYGEALGLSRRLADTPYLRFHSVIRSGLDWLRGQSARSAADVARHLDTTWSERGPADHPAATHYRRAAQRMLVNAGAAMSGQALTAERRLTIEGVTITARADHIQTASGSIVIQRMKAGRLAKSGETPKARYALLQAMVKRDEGVAASFLHISLLDGSQKNATVAAGKLTEAVDEAAAALSDIAAGRFDPKRNGRTCPTCPFFFICPTDGLRV